MARSTRGVNHQGRALHFSIAAIGKGPSDQIPFFSSSWTLADSVIGWTSLAKHEMQGFGVVSHRKIPRAADHMSSQRADLGEACVAVGFVFRPGVAIDVAGGGALVL